MPLNNNATPRPFGLPLGGKNSPKHIAVAMQRGSDRLLAEIVQQLDATFFGDGIVRQVDPSIDAFKGIGTAHMAGALCIGPKVDL